MTDNERWHPLNHASVTRQREGRNSVRPIFRPKQTVEKRLRRSRIFIAQGPTKKGTSSVGAKSHVVLISYAAPGGALRF